MDNTKEHPTLATLQAQRQSLRHELAIVVKQIDQGERARARIAELIKLLEQGQRQAA
jgi:capsule polysaccharide export protein KpsE/RkpR